MAESLMPGTSNSRAKLRRLRAKAEEQCLLQNWNDAADLFAQAVELQAEINGDEMAIANADLLVLYARCMFRVATTNNDILGGKAAALEEQATASKPAGSGAAGGSRAVLAAGESKEAKESAVKALEKAAAAKKPFFSFEGDGDLDESDGDEEGNAVEKEKKEEEEDDEDELVNAWQALDLARILLEKKLEALLQGDVRQTKESLADVHDMLGMLALEQEAGADILPDLRKSLALRKELYQDDPGLIGEAELKLATALDYTSAMAGSAESVPGSDSPSPQALREEAVQHMQAAINYARLRLDKEESMLKSTPSGPVTKEDIKETKDMIADMKERLVDLRKPPSTIAKDKPDGGLLPLDDLMKSVDDEKRRMLQAIMSGAHDVSNLVKRKKSKDEIIPERGEAPAAAATDEANGTGQGRKRGAEGDTDTNGHAGAEWAKRVKVDEGNDGNSAAPNST
ncbi:MAG: hypothetical protein M1826_006716 [Phylliscum demangeonii]|nr:MAG: hypothetical protein M1826_006716 [Phylliscum demangeonii]